MNHSRKNLPIFFSAVCGTLWILLGTVNPAVSIAQDNKRVVPQREARKQPASKLKEIAPDANRSAWGVWSDLMESSMTYGKKPVTVVGTDKVFMFGGEKEGSSSRITRVMGPSTEEFRARVDDLDAAKKEEFVRELLDGWEIGRAHV